MDGSVQNREASPARHGIAERIWDAARAEFSRRGYHGARVQGIARGASCNVALMYRHWASKRALYLDVLRTVWLASAARVTRLLEERPAEPGAVVGAYLEAMMGDPQGAQILVREVLDGAPFFSQLARAEPSILDPVRRAASAFAPGANGPSADPMLAVLTVGGLAALVASASEAARPFLHEPIPPDAWRRQVLDLLVSLGPARADGGSA